MFEQMLIALQLPHHRCRGLTQHGSALNQTITLKDFRSVAKEQGQYGSIIIRDRRNGNNQSIALAAEEVICATRFDINEALFSQEFS